MYISRVKPGLVETSRLDPDYYNPIYLEDVVKLKDFGCIKLSTVGKFFTGPFGSKLPSNLYIDEGIPLFRVGNVGQMEVRKENLAYLDKRVHEELKASEVRSGDVLIVKASVGEKICKLPDSIPKANITQHIIGLRSNGRFDMDYVCSFLFSSYGTKQLIRRSLGSIIQYLGVVDARTVLIPELKNDAQKYIGNKVRQAETLRAWAMKCRASANMDFRRICSFELVENLKEKPRKIVHELISPVSLGPEFNRAGEGQTKFPDSYTLKEIIDDCKCGDPIKSSDRVKGIYPYYGASGPIDIHNEFNFDGEYIIVAQDGSIGFSSVARGRFWANNHVWILSLKGEYDADVVAYYLENYYPYWKGMTTGSVIPKVTSGNLLTIKIPKKLLSIPKLGELLRESIKSIELSSRLTNAAKQLVEALIENKLTEQELISAQQALERGDNTLDRQILSRSTTKGIGDEDGAPLFPDLDQLYDLLNQAEKSQEVIP